MHSRDAYEAILRALEADPHRRVINSEFDAAVFGNFFVSFVEEGVPRSLVNDRGQLVFFTGPGGTGRCTVIVQSLAEADEQAVLEALCLSRDSIT